jgi:predicted DCC family thiol-disulfide oxidoreductase YuxK
MERIILFDGICNLCNHSVQFIVKRDPAGIFKFASFQSGAGEKLLKEHGFKGEINSFILIEQGKVYQKSSAALRVAGKLHGPWKLLVLFQIIPPFLRDLIYDLVAKNRYRWFGKKDSCMLPSPDLKKRFLQ